ncbi:MAG: hypothetical protein Q8M20_15955 [Rhodocyclaceae bacterium]|nr:hypothetical protein [Rhodocyclaceae bacterium]MDZ4215243.1 hypothetical protein [Rhodocyclaceae bacterium]
MMPSRQRRLFSSALMASLLIAGCSSTPQNENVRGASSQVTNAAADVVAEVLGAPLIPDIPVVIGPSVTYPLEKLVYWGMWAGAAYLILDPLSPNWQIEEARFPENHVRFQLAMKRYYTGGAGEARVIFHRRAKELMRAGGFGSYEVVEYSEGMESSVLGSQRVAEGVVRFKKSAG